MRGRTESIFIGIDILLSILLLLVLMLASGALGTRTETVTSTTTATGSIAGLHELTFQQEGIDCGVISPAPSLSYIAPWGVTIWNGAVGNLSLENPPNANISSQYSATAYSPSNQNYSAITFTVPYGLYNYEVRTGYLGPVYGQIAFSLPNIPVTISIPDACCSDACPP